MQLATVPEIRKIFSFEVIMTFFGNFFEKYRDNPQIFKSRSRFSDLLVSVSKFWPGFGIKISTAPLEGSNDIIRLVKLTDEITIWVLSKKHHL